MASANLARLSSCRVMSVENDMAHTVMKEAESKKLCKYSAE